MGRYRRRYSRGYGGPQTSLTVMIIIVLLAVATGYAGTKYIIYPYLLNGQTQEQDKNDEKKEKNVQDSGVSAITSLPGVLTDGQDVPDETKEQDKGDQTKPKEEKDKAANAGESGTKSAAESQQNQGQNQSAPSITGGGAFALQFGNFKEKAGALQRIDELKVKGINAYVFESDGSFRVLGNAYDSKEKAKQAADIVSNSAVEVFVVDMKSIV